MAFGRVRPLIRGNRAHARGLLAALAMGGLTLGLSALVAVDHAQSADPGNFRTFVERELWPEAEARGIRRDVFVAAFADVSPDPQVLALTRKQPEYTKPV